MLAERVGTVCERQSPTHRRRTVGCGCGRTRGETNKKIRVKNKSPPKKQGNSKQNKPRTPPRSKEDAHRGFPDDGPNQIPHRGKRWGGHKRWGRAMNEEGGKRCGTNPMGLPADGEITVHIRRG